MDVRTSVLYIILNCCQEQGTRNRSELGMGEWTYVYRSGELYFAADDNMLQIEGKNNKI